MWDFEPTKPMSTYITALIAGEYHEVQHTYEGAHGTIPLGHYCRQSLVEYLERDLDDLLTITRQGFAFFEDAFDFPYPFGKYDQLYVPEYNMGAMENAGAVTLRDEYLPRSRQPRSFYEFRCSVILHEMAHMWFGDLVTMRWWDDLWLNESFAEWACYHAEVEATEFTDSWTGFANARKQTGYRADQLPSTHPIAADNVDLQAVEVNFDMITYAKGASVLKQLVAWVGLDDFLGGLQQYFKDFAYGNSEFADLLAALEKSSGRELAGWAKEWLQTAGVNTLAAEFDLDDEGRYTRLAVRQSAHPDWPTLRRHRIGIGLYSDVDGRLVRTRYVETDVEGELTEIAELVGETQPDLLLLNDNDLAYAKIRLDERSLATAIGGLSRLDDSLARALVWGAAWDMTRDAEMAASDYVDLVLANIGAETDPWGVSRIPSTAATAATAYAAPAKRAALQARWESGLRELALAAEPGSDQQLTFVRSFAGAAHSDSALDDVAGLLDGTWEIDGLTVDQDLRWALVTSSGRGGSRRVAHRRPSSRATPPSRARSTPPPPGPRSRTPRPRPRPGRWRWSAPTCPTRPPARSCSRSCATARRRCWRRTSTATSRPPRRSGTTWAPTAPRPCSTTSSPAPSRGRSWWRRSTPGSPAPPAPAAAQRYVQEGRADALRAMAAQERDARS